MSVYTVLDKIDGLLKKRDSSMNVNDCLEQTLDNLKQLQGLTGDKYFCEQLQAMTEYVKSLPDEQCEKWCVNKRRFDTPPVPIPDEPVYGILEMHAKKREDARPNELFKPLYTMRMFTDLEQARETERATVKQWKTLYDGIIKNDEDVHYHPALYKVKFESI
jgi:hypothetical protein